MSLLVDHALKKGKQKSMRILPERNPLDEWIRTSHIHHKKLLHIPIDL